MFNAVGVVEGRHSLYQIESHFSGEEAETSLFETGGKPESATNNI